MSEVEVFTSVRAVSTLDDHHMKRTRYDHQISLVAHEHSNQQLQAGGGGLSDLYDDIDSIALYILAADNSVIFINEFESVQNHRNSSDVHHKESL